MAKNLSFEQLAKAAAQGVAIALTAHGAPGAEGEQHALLQPIRLIFGGPRELYSATFTQSGAQVQVTEVAAVRE